MTMSPRFFALISAAGLGERAGTQVPKQYVPLLGKPMLAHTIAAFTTCTRIDAVHVVVAPEDNWPETLGASAFSGCVQFHRVGGSTRAQSVLNGIKAIKVGELDWMLIHDSARPCITPAMIEALIAELDDDPVGGLLALPVPDTVKRSDAGGRVSETISRDGLWLAQTPQMFRYSLLRDALERFPEVTDEASAVECMGLKPKLVVGDARNIKVTYPADFALAEEFLKSR